MVNLQHILQNYGEATGLFTNMQKSEVYPINCDDIDLAPVTTAFPGAVSQFPCRYLGLPLHVGRTRRADEQILIDKIGARLPGGKGRLLNKAGRLTLVTSVLSSIPTYHITVFPLSKWAIKCIDRIRRSFLWRGEENAKGGHCQVNWRRVCRPKKLGGLGILDLTNFARALRLRQSWYKWTDSERPWSGFSLKATHIEEELFKTSTIITVGDGKRTGFWKDAPKDIAPLCYSRAWRKNQTVADSLSRRNWMRGLRRISTPEGMHQFIHLWHQIQDVCLNELSKHILGHTSSVQHEYANRMPCRLKKSDVIAHSMKHKFGPT